MMARSATRPTSKGSYVDTYYSIAESRGRRGTLVGQVMGLLGFSLLFTAGGAVLGRVMGPGAMILSIVGIFFQATWFHLLLSVGTAVLFSGFVMYDIQRLRYAEGTGTSGAVWLAVSIYLDIFNLFLAILRIFGIFGSSDD